MFDHGYKKNLEVYGNEMPPEYNIKALENLSMDIFITVSESDPYCNKEDFDYISQMLKSSKKTIHKVGKYNHNDYLWSKSAHEDIYKYIKEFLE